jgi:hypothetical protein
VNTRVRSGGEAGETAGLCAHRLVQRVIGGTSERDGRFRVEILSGRIILGNHLEVDAGFVHLADAQCAEIVQLALKWRVLLAAQRAQFR